MQQRQDTFVRLDGFTKGNVYINGFNLGRYWNPAGPQKTLYLPAPLLREGENELAVLELEGIDGPAPGTFDRLRGFGIKKFKKLSKNP